MGLFSFLSLGQIQTLDYSFNITSLGLLREGIPTAAGEPVGVHTYEAFAVSMLACLMAIVGIFCYKTKRLHKNTIVFSMLFTVLSVVLLAYDVYAFAADCGGQVGWNYMIIAPMIAFVAEIVAYRMIVADWKKIEAADRLR